MTPPEIRVHLLNRSARENILNFFEQKELDGALLSGKVAQDILRKHSELNAICSRKEYQIQNFDACLIIYSAIIFRRILPKYETFLSELDPLNECMASLPPLSLLTGELNIDKIQIDFKGDREPLIITDKRIIDFLYQHIYPGLTSAYNEFVKPNFRNKESYSKQGKTPISVKKLKLLAAKSLCYFEEHEPQLGKNVMPFVIDLFHLADVKALDTYSDPKSCRDSLKRLAKEHAIRNA